MKHQLCDLLDVADTISMNGYMVENVEDLRGHSIQVNTADEGSTFLPQQEVELTADGSACAVDNDNVHHDFQFGMEQPMSPDLMLTPNMQLRLKTAQGLQPRLESSSEGAQRGQVSLLGEDNDELGRSAMAGAAAALAGDTEGSDGMSTDASQESIEATLRARHAAGELETGLFSVKGQYVVMEAVDEQLVFTWFDEMTSLDARPGVEAR